MAAARAEEAPRADRVDDEDGKIIGNFCVSNISDQVGSALLVSQRNDQGYIRMVELPLSLLPLGCNEGEVLTLEIRRNEEETMALRRNDIELQQALANTLS